MTDEWLTPKQVAEALGSKSMDEAVRIMLRHQLIPGRKDKKKRWWVNKVELERLRAFSKQDSATRPPLKSDLGMVEVSMALAGIGTAIAAFLPGVSSIPLILRVTVALLASILAVFSAYAALWLLAWYCSKEESRWGHRDIVALIGDPTFGPYWLLAIALLVLLVLAALMSGLALLR